MKSTGVVRKLDDLGRIVIPIELRRTMDSGSGIPWKSSWRMIRLFSRSIILPAFSAMTHGT